MPKQFWPPILAAIIQHARITFMSSVEPIKFVSIEDYLTAEAISPVKHEYVDGRLFAMAGGKNRHNRIASRVLVALGKQLSSNVCEVYNSDTKVRIQTNSRRFFYYPDSMVVCESNSDDDPYQDHPKVIVEVVSERTRRTDEGEKLLNYLTIASLNTYILLEQDRATARVFERLGSEFFETMYTDPTSVIPLPSIGCTLNLSEIYAGIQFKHK